MKSKHENLLFVLIIGLLLAIAAHVNADRLACMSNGGSYIMGRCF